MMAPFILIGLINGTVIGLFGIMHQASMASSAVAAFLSGLMCGASFIFGKGAA